MMYAITLGFLGFAIGFLIRGGLSDLQRAKLFNEGKAEGICEALIFTRNDRPPAPVIELRRAK